MNEQSYWTIGTLREVLNSFPQEMDNVKLAIKTTLGVLKPLEISGHSHFMLHVGDLKLKSRKVLKNETTLVL